MKEVAREIKKHEDGKGLLPLFGLTFLKFKMIIQTSLCAHTIIAIGIDCVQDESGSLCFGQDQRMMNS